ncbi:hypothetical protein FE88_31440 [Azospirillum brasilense]|nr:hypothetical protein AMK58_21825 [Azospirillum brasilense]OPH12071.1 hypothetical protein FE89_30165 [Azospirillum brasilense]OPH17531.1 hypothetical protein FE88_31440 [Azospirillum brasilense]PWC82238.1 hypothetical protein AEJ54_31895 [Azospirillum sp. Sp 7]
MAFMVIRETDDSKGKLFLTVRGLSGPPVRKLYEEGIRRSDGLGVIGADRIVYFQFVQGAQMISTKRLPVI